MYAEILLPLYLHEEKNLPNRQAGLTYKVPENFETKIKLGSAVVVPLRNRRYTGIVTRLHNQHVPFATRDLVSVKEHGLLPAWHIPVALWMADYYEAPLYKVFKLMLPPRLWKPTEKTAHEVMYQRSKAPIPDRLGKREIELIKKFEHKNAWTRKELSNFPLTILKNLEKKGILQSFKGDIRGLTHSPVPEIANKKLTLEQEQALQTFRTSAQKKYLLYGVTGSGKTELYLRMALETVQQGKQVILTVPEIALTPQLIDYFLTAFPEKIAVLHSRLSAGEREREWGRIQNGTSRIVIGSRSAIFAPCHDLGLIVMDEEHEWSYKQDSMPYYHAREVAERIAQETGARLVLGSATPSIETMYRTDGREFEKITLTQRVNKDQKLPKVTIVDMREELHKGNFSIFSDALESALEETFKAGEQAILFLNRRGHASCVICRECGYTPRCRACDVSLTHHRNKMGFEMMICHHCGAREKPPVRCPNCKSAAIRFVGIGTQRVEEELQKRFPAMRILRADKDTTTEKESFERIYRAVKNHTADVLIGTQMIGKGLDIANVTLVGMVLADVGLHLPDFRASERMFQVMTQVAGRAGRAEKPGRVILQTYCPDHISLTCAARHDYTTFYTEELKARKQLNYPPFSQIIKMTFKHAEQKICSIETARIEKLLKTFLENNATDQLAESSSQSQSSTEKNTISPLPKIQIYSAPALIPRKHNTYRWHIYLQGDHPQTLLKKFIILHPLNDGWIIDVNPTDMG